MLAKRRRLELKSCKAMGSVMMAVLLGMWSASALTLSTDAAANPIRKVVTLLQAWARGSNTPRIVHGISVRRVACV